MQNFSVKNWFRFFDFAHSINLALLANIGEEYKNTRHNIGFDIVDQLAKILKGKFNSAKYGNILKSKYAGKQIILLKPNTLMNLSGKAVLYWL